MNKIIKIVAATLLATSTLSALTYEYSTLYKDTRVMGMGGANVALGGESSALFYNPAGLSGMDPREGLELELVNISTSVSEKTVGFVTDLITLSQTAEKTIADNTLGDFSPFITKYTGSPISLNVNDYTSVAFRAKNWAFSIGVLASANFSFQVHNLLSSSGIIEINGFTNTGLISGLSVDFLENSLHLGLGAKLFTGEVEGAQFNNAVQAGLTLEHISNLMSSKDQMKYLNETGMLTAYTQPAFDIGAILDLDAIIPFGDHLHPSVGISYLNIGNIGTATSVVIPQTVNVGIAIRPMMYLFADWLFTDWVFTADYVDLMYANTDGSFTKRIRAGARMSVIKGWLGELTASAGMYNGDWTAGAQLRVLFFDLMASTYAEELGAFAGQDPDRRYQVSLAVGW